MVRKLLIGIAAVVVVLSLVVASRPSTFHVERSITISAPADRAFAEVNDFHRWMAWSPFENVDPDLKRTYGGSASGIGATYSWAGEKSGEGKMTIEQSVPASVVGIKLEFVKPFAATNIARFAFADVPAGTKVTWSMDGHQSFICKAASLVMDVDKTIGCEFERGLQALKGLAENPSTAETAAK